MTAPAIGIDLGYSNSRVAVYLNGRVEVIPNAQGNRMTPSSVVFNGTKIVIISDVKRLIGRKFADPSVQKDIPFLPFKVIDDRGRPKIEVQYTHQDKTLFPEEVSSIVLAKLKESAELYLGKNVKNAVITVPAFFNDTQRQATKDACSIAGLNVLRVINEPTAGALACGLRDENFEKRNVLIYHLGRSTFDVSIINIEEGIFETIATAGNTHLGGKDFDSNMVEHFIEEFKTKHGHDIRNVPFAIQRLRTNCESAKRCLSNSDAASIDIDSLGFGIDFHSTVTRALFEELNGELIKSTIDTVERVMKDAEMSKSDINVVVLTGGSTRIPMVQRLLQQFLGKVLFATFVNPDEAVVAGAAIMAAILEDEDVGRDGNSRPFDYHLLSVGTNNSNPSTAAGETYSATKPNQADEETRKSFKKQLLSYIKKAKSAINALQLEEAIKWLDSSELILEETPNIGPNAFVDPHYAVDPSSEDANKPRKNVMEAKECLENARKSFLRGNFENAKCFLLKAQRINSKTSSHVDMCMKKVRDARDQRNTMSKENPDTKVQKLKDEADSYIQIAMNAIADKNYDRALIFLDKAEDLYPSQRAKELLKKVRDAKSKPRDHGNTMSKENPVSNNTPEDQKNQKLMNNLNKDEADTYIQIATNAFEDNNYDRALIFLDKAEDLYPSERAQDLRKKVLRFKKYVS